MGKRELALVVAFIALGAVLFRFTAPPAPGSDNLNARSLMQKLHRTMSGDRANAHTTSTQVVPLDGSVDQIRFALRGADVTVTGEDRADMEVGLTVTSTGYDADEALRWAKATRLKTERGGPSLGVSVDYPSEATQRATLAVKVPQRMRVRFDSGSGALTVDHVAVVEILGALGATKVTNVPGGATVTHRGGTLTIDTCGALRISARNSHATITGVTGPLSGSAVGSPIEISRLAGSIELDMRSTDLTLADASGLEAPVRIDANSGSVTIAGLRVDARLDGKGTRFDVALAAAVPLAIYGTNEPIRITPPPSGGYTLDAVATDGRLDLQDGGPAVSGGTTEQRASGPVRGGGPTIMLRASHGDITLRSSRPGGK